MALWRRTVHYKHWLMGGLEDHIEELGERGHIVAFCFRYLDGEDGCVHEDVWGRGGGGGGGGGGASSWASLNEPHTSELVVKNSRHSKGNEIYCRGRTGQGTRREGIYIVNTIRKKVQKLRERDPGMSRSMIRAYMEEHWLLCS